MPARTGFACGLLLSFLPAALGFDLLNKYPTKLESGDRAPQNARPWTFEESDMFELSGFKLEIGADLKVEAGRSDLGIGHTKDGAVWAVVLPRDKSALQASATRQTEAVSHLWIRFHPARINRLFPPDTVTTNGNRMRFAEIQRIAGAKLPGSFHAGLNVMIPEPRDLVIDADTVEGPRRFFVVDHDAASVKYIGAFESRAMPKPKAIQGAEAEKVFDQVWEAFDREYALFVHRPAVDWARLREEFRPRAASSRTWHELGLVLANLIKPLRDLHAGVAVDGVEMPSFNRPRFLNANRSAWPRLLGPLRQAGPSIQWTMTSDRIGYVAILDWNRPDISPEFDRVLDQLKESRGLILDVRLNGGGREPVAREVAGRFVPSEFVYAYSQVRTGPRHSDLSEKRPRSVSPSGPGRYEKPVTLLIGERCMSSNESFIAMMSGAPQVTTMGDHTCGSSGNPRELTIGALTVRIPRWIDYLPDGTLLDEKGFQPKTVFKPAPGAFEGDRDDLLKLALEEYGR